MLYEARFFWGRAQSSRSDDCGRRGRPPRAEHADGAEIRGPLLRHGPREPVRGAGATFPSAPETFF